MSNPNTPNVLYLVLGALASLFSTFKVIQTRRKLQQSRQTPVSLTEAIVHTAFDTIDVFSKEYQKITNVVEQRMLQLEAPSSLSGNNRVFAIQDENHFSSRKALPSPTNNTPLSSSMLNHGNSVTGRELLQNSQLETKQLNMKPIIVSPPSAQLISTISTHDPMLASIPDHHTRK
ncbi:hypothetical protein C9374_008421 [Naegleria lovaniensis]|uniref:Uncharacterized protein n=1 Tax=Naegleria lovaniensis TaxID=51637 RepID=A0AA88GLC9_NAELO|nr:uncharacterized protein C9374_008421 [Naegleria lovaniensis]KAG2378278.1 hypothetical protein C9374_008421 [Naegleria lovaniensis]